MRNGAYGAARHCAGKRQLQAGLAKLEALRVAGFGTSFAMRGAASRPTFLTPAIQFDGEAAHALHAQTSRCCLRASHTPSTTWAAPRTLIRSGFSTNHIPTLRVLSGPTTHSRECPLGARNSMSPSPTVSIAKASRNLLFHTAPSPPVFVLCMTSPLILQSMNRFERGLVSGTACLRKWSAKRFGRSDSVPVHPR